MKEHWSRVNLVKRAAASQRFTRDYCPFISQCKQKKVYFNPYIYAEATNNPQKSIKLMSVFRSRDRCLSLENICHGFLMLHRRQMTSECKYSNLQMQRSALLDDMSDIVTLYIYTWIITYMCNVVMIHSYRTTRVVRRQRSSPAATKFK